MTDLKPCPFCGGKVPAPTRRYMGVLICPACNAYGPGNSDMTNDELIAAWNARAERTCRDASLDKSTQFYCSVCECTVGIPLLWGDLKYCPGCGARVERGDA